jgi:hypothetical protein
MNDARSIFALGDFPDGVYLPKTDFTYLDQDDAPWHLSSLEVGNKYPRPASNSSAAAVSYRVNHSFDTDEHGVIAGP